MSTPSHLAQTAAGEAAQAAPPASATRARPNAGLAGIELPFGLTPFNLALLAMLVGAFVVFRRYDPPALTFDESALQNIGNVFASLFLVAAFIERAIEVILTPIRGDDANRFQALIEAHRAAGEHDAAAKIESELAEHRLGSRRRAFLLAVGLGMLAAVLGLRGLEGLLEPESAPGPGFRFFDIVLTGLVIGGGADGIHKVVKAMTDYMEMVSRRSQAAG